MRSDFLQTHTHTPDFLFYFISPCSADHEERDWPPCNKVVFFGLATNALNVRNNRHFPPLTGGCSEGLGAF